MRNAKYRTSSSPPEHLPSSINLATHECSDETARTGSFTSSCSSFLSTTPPSSIPRYGNTEDFPSRCSSESTSPSTPDRKNWEKVFKIKFPKGTIDDCSSSTESNNARIHSTQEDYLSTSRSVHLSHGVPLLVPLTGQTQGQGQMKLIPPRNESSNMSKHHKIAYESDEYLSGESDFSNNSPSNRKELSQKGRQSDRSTRGGSFFSKMFSKKKGDGKPIRQKNRTRSEDHGMDKSIRGRAISDDHGMDKSMRGRVHQRTYSDERMQKISAEDVSSGRMLIRQGSKKEKKLVFTEVRNSVNNKDSSTAYLGEEKSIHRGKFFAPQTQDQSGNADRLLTPVKEELDTLESSFSTLQPIEGVDSWSESSRNLIFPAIAAKCQLGIFKTFQLRETTNGDNSTKSRFGCISLGKVKIAKEHIQQMKVEDLKWKECYFELRQNYLLEYASEQDSGSRPRGYAFLQDATVKPYLRIKNSLRLEYTQHQEKKTRVSVIISLSSGMQEQKWLTCLIRAANMKIEDLYEYDASVNGKELGSGRYASIRPGRRRRNLMMPSSGPHSSLGGNPPEESASGILKKKPSFPSFSNLNMLSEDDCESALKVIDKDLFWKHVHRGSERADSIVREICVQSTLITKARDHRGFLQLKSFFETRDKVVLEMELLEGMDLYQYIKKEHDLSQKAVDIEEKAAEIMYDIFNCIAVMKKYGIAHRDIKPANILMANKPGVRVNVADFGNATFVGEDGLVRGRCGTVGYVAPEILLAQKNSGYMNKIDEFSAGVILYVLLCGYEPFFGETEKELIEENKKAFVEYPDEDWLVVSLEGRDLVEKLLRPDPSRRLDASRALKHPWITRRFNKKEKFIQDESCDNSFKTDEFACVIS